LCHQQLDFSQAKQPELLMAQKASADVEMTIVLPLDVAANKLLRIEEELRHLNMKVLNFEQERESGHLSGLIEARLERIHETLDSIRERLSDLNSNIQPTREDVSRASTNDPHGTARRMGDSDADYPFELDNTEYADRKPQPDRDD
jgi:hypothetical protein